MARNILVILFSYFTYIKDLLAIFYWQIKFIKYARLSGSGHLNLPITISGTGIFRLGKNFLIRRGVNFFLDKHAELRFGQNTFIGNEVYFRVTANSFLHTGDDLTIMKNVTLKIENQWIFGSQILIGANCSIGSREAMFQGKFKLGYNCVIGENSIIDISDDVILGDNVTISPHCCIFTHSHNYNLDSIRASTPVILGKVVIGDGCWIGYGSIILPNITIGANTVIAAGSVITKDCYSDSLYGGVPAKLIKPIK